MSNSPTRVIFGDGTILYTVGDCVTVQSDRLHDTLDAAWEAYSDRRNTSANSPYYANIPKEELAAAKADEETVTIETRYGAPGWKEMLTCVCRASKTAKLITYGPEYPDRADGWQ